jgi:hypothetical protein
MRVTIWNLWLDVAERGIAANAWNDSHLQSLADECAKVDVLAALVHAMNSDRTYGNHLFESCANDRKALAKLLGVVGATPAQVSVFYYIMPRGWIRRDQVEYNQLIDLDIEDIHLADATISPGFSRSARIVKSHTNIYQRLTHFLSALALPVIEGTGFKAADTHTNFQQVRIGCVLTRYRNAHGELPSSLEALVPAFLDRVPTDVMDGQPIRYRRAESGGYLLWSIGQNRIDDGGKSDAEAKRHKSPDWVSEVATTYKP